MYILSGVKKMCHMLLPNTFFSVFLVKIFPNLSMKGQPGSCLIALPLIYSWYMYARRGEERKQRGEKGQVAF